MGNYEFIPEEQKRLDITTSILGRGQTPANIENALEISLNVVVPWTHSGYPQWLCATCALDLNLLVVINGTAADQFLRCRRCDEGGDLLERG